MVYKFKRVLLVGFKVFIIYGVFIILIWIFCLFMNIYWLNGFLFIMLIVIFIMIVFVVLFFKVFRVGMYGDFVVEKVFDKDKFFRLIYLIQLIILIEYDKESMVYFWLSIVEMFEIQYQVYLQFYINFLG